MRRSGTTSHSRTPCGRPGPIVTVGECPLAVASAHGRDALPLAWTDGNLERDERTRAANVLTVVQAHACDDYGHRRVIGNVDLLSVDGWVDFADDGQARRSHVVASCGSRLGVGLCRSATEPDKAQDSK